MKSSPLFPTTLSSIAAATLLVGTADAQFTVYDDFNSASVSMTKWEGIDTSANFPTISGGVASLTGSQYFRSTEAFPIGSTIRIEFVTVAGNAVVAGTNSNTSSGFAADDALYTRNDGGGAVYGDGSVAQGGAPTPTVGFIDYVIGFSNLEIFDDNVNVFTSPRFGTFDEAQRVELGVYQNTGGQQLVVEQVLVQVPEPGSLALLSLGGIGLLAHRRRS